MHSIHIVDPTEARASGTAAISRNIDNEISITILIYFLNRGGGGGIRFVGVGVGLLLHDLLSAL